MGNHKLRHGPGVVLVASTNRQQQFGCNLFSSLTFAVFTRRKKKEATRRLALLRSLAFFLFQ